MRDCVTRRAAMGKIVAGLASSHAGTFAAPETWDARRARNRAIYQRRFGVEPPQPPQLEAETLEANRDRYARVQAGLGRLRAELEARRPDALIVVGDDQNENFSEDIMPQLAIYTGARVHAVAH